MTRRGDRSASPAPRVEVYGRPGCHLCEQAVEVVARVCADVGADWSERDISGDDALMRTYGEQLPVTFVDGRQHDFWRVDERRLRAALEARPRARTQARSRWGRRRT